MIPESMTRREVQCKSCGARMAADCFHTGFNNSGFLYCDRDQTVMVFSSYHKVYTKLVGDVHPWVLAWKKRTEELKRIEDNLISCPCGGRFSFANPLICPVCKGVFSEPIAKDIHFIVLDRAIYGWKTNVWKSTGH